MRGTWTHCNYCGTWTAAPHRHAIKRTAAALALYVAITAIILTPFARYLTGN